jgi:hypothetical protein
LTKADLALARALQQRLPDRLFDVHMHPYRRRDVRPAATVLKAGPARAGLAVWQRCLGPQVGATRLCGAMCTPFPSKDGDMEAATRFAVAEAGRRKGCVATMLVSPSSDPAAVERFVEEHPHVVGFKPYHLLAGGSEQAAPWGVNIRL